MADLTERAPAVSAASLPEGLVRFCRDQHPRLVGTIAYLVDDIELAQDLAQETLLRVARKWDRVGSLESPGGWAHRVAVNLALSALRSRRTRRRIDERIAARAEPVDATDLDGALAIRRAVASLPERQRVAIVLRYYADLPVGEVAEAMGCPEGTVKTLTSRGIANLRAMGLEADA